MTANLTPQYHDAEERFKRAADHAEKLAALREMIALLPKHKGTEKMLADLRKRLSKLEEEAAHPPRGGPGHRVEVGHVRREGAGQWVLLGPAERGQVVAPRGADARAPRGRRVPVHDARAAARNDGVRGRAGSARRHARGRRGPHGAVPPEPRARRRRRPPRPRRDGGRRRRPRRACSTTFSPAPGSGRGRGPLPPDAPPFLQPKPVLVLGNKAEEDDGTFAALAREAVGADLPFFSVSATTGAGLEPLREVLFRELKRIRVFGKEPGKKPDFERPFVLPEGATIHDFAMHVHKEIAERLKFARLWGHAKFDGQQVDRHHVLADKDVVELHA